MKTAVIQLGATDNKSNNIQKAVELVEQAIKNKAEFILLPEIFNFRGVPGRLADFQKAYESIPGESLQPLMALARKHKVYILAGSIYERAAVDETKAYNTSVLVDHRGKIKAKYRKIHLFDAVIGRTSICESKRFLAGTRCVVTQVNRFRVGLSVCYDLRFPDLYQKYSSKGADVMCVPSSFTAQTGKAHWEVLLRARAIENLCYVLAPNQIGRDGRGVLQYGHSMIIDPWGSVLAKSSGDKQEIIYADLNKNEITKARKVLRFL